MDQTILEAIEIKAKKINKNRSEFINLILTHFAYNEQLFNQIMARKAAQDLYYWQSRLKAIESEPELFEMDLKLSK